MQWRDGRERSRQICRERWERKRSWVVSAPWREVELEVLQQWESPWYKALYSHMKLCWWLGLCYGPGLCLDPWSWRIRVCVDVGGLYYHWRRWGCRGSVLQPPWAGSILQQPPPGGTSVDMALVELAPRAWVQESRTYPLQGQHGRAAPTQCSWCTQEWGPTPFPGRARELALVAWELESRPWCCGHGRAGLTSSLLLPWAGRAGPSPCWLMQMGELAPSLAQGWGKAGPRGMDLGEWEILSWPSPGQRWSQLWWCGHGKAGRLTNSAIIQTLTRNFELVHANVFSI